MKNSILTMAASVLLTSAIITSCNSPAQKVENAQDNVIEASKDLDKANQEYLNDIANYRRETAEKIALNNQSIAEFNARIENEKNEAKADYKKKIAELEQKNSDMKKRLDDYKEEGKEKWEGFKKEFSNDMEELGMAFKNVFVKSDK